MANDATRGVGNSSTQTVDDHVPREWEDPQAKRCGGMERSGSLCGRGCRSAEADVAPLEEFAALLGYSAGCCRCEALSTAAAAKR